MSASDLPRDGARNGDKALPTRLTTLGAALLTADDVAAYLQIDRSTVFRLAGRALPVVAIGRARRFRVEDVIAFVESSTRGGHADPGGVDRVQQLLRGIAGDLRRPRSKNLEVSANPSVHRARKQEPWRSPGPTPETNR